VMALMVVACLCVVSTFKHAFLLTKMFIFDLIHAPANNFSYIGRYR